MKQPKFFTTRRIIPAPKIINKTQFKLGKGGNFFVYLFKQFWDINRFILLLCIYLLYKLLFSIANFKLFSIGFLFKIQDRIKFGLLHIYMGLTRLFDKRNKRSLTRIDLIELSIKNMMFKKTRSVITIGGMAIAVGSIVFLVSIGYGLQDLVINRVARLDEMKQADVFPQTGGKLKINDKVLSDFKGIPNISMALPLIAVVGHVSYQNSESDMAVYGVTSDYLKQSAIKPVKGRIFDSNELAFNVDSLPTGGEVAGASTEDNVAGIGEKISDVNFNINPSGWIRVRETPSIEGQVLGYTKQAEGQSQGEEFWGGSYESADNGKTLGKWIKAPVLLWKMEKCEISQGDCEGGKYVVMRGIDGQQIQKPGYFAEINIKVVKGSVTQTKVLGVTTTDWVDIASEAGIIKPAEAKKVDLGTSAHKQAVVNRAMLKVLGIKEDASVGREFDVSFVVVGDLVDSNEKIESVPASYTIAGVVPDEKTPVFYVPFIDLRTLGIQNFSQVKIVVDKQNSLTKARRQIEALGFVTTSVSDTVAQITSLFSTARQILLLLGMVALSIAALGMFNTLTVSLLERTREVGLMKAMGMKSQEVKELFLTESMTMGFFGGILGIIAGIALGKLVSFLLSVFAVIKGVGIVDISTMPLSFIIFVIFISLLVGILTGLYPAHRATKISALDALRYE